MWRCQRSGECCKTGVLTMTHAERDALRLATAIPLTFTPHEDPRFVQLLGSPCPLLTEQNECSVYASRPYNCRRFGCFRDDMSEPFQADAIPVAVLTDRTLRRQYARMQRKAQRWADAHGWSQ